jgi:protein involved in polysaccharide export with SLBB domain
LVEKLRQFVKEPQVTVMVTEYRSQPISILGRVTSPGASVTGPEKLCSR